MPRILSGPLERAMVVEKPDPLLREILEKSGFQVAWVPRSPGEDELIELLREHRPQVLFKRSRVPVTRRVLRAADDLVAVQLCSIGTDSVDLRACAERGILAFNDPVSNGRSVVELVIGHLIALSRRLYETFDDTNNGVWEKSNRERYEIRGKTLGVVGVGNIGRQVARAASALGMEILFYDTREIAREVARELGWTDAESLENLFRNSDSVSVHVSATDHRGNSNAGLITRDLMFSLGVDRPEPCPRLFVNLARGIVYEPADLLAAVQAGRIQRAAVDVFPSEPAKNGPGWENPFAAEPRIMTTPHVGAATREAQPRIARRVAKTMKDFSRFCAIRDCVFSPRTRIPVSDVADGRAVLMVVHSTARGTKKALDDAIFEAEASNLRSQHRDFDRFGVAVDVNLLDRALSEPQLERIVDHTQALTGDPGAVRLVRQVVLGG